MNMLEACEQFNQTLTAELRQLSETRGDQFARVARSAFFSTNIFSLIEVLCNASSQEDLAKRSQFVIEQIANLMSNILADVGHGMSDADLNETMKFADRMFSIQNATVESLTARIQ